MKFWGMEHPHIKIEPLTISDKRLVHKATVPISSNSMYC